MVAIACDLYEAASGVPERLRELGASVEITHLDAGDYALGYECLVERKNVRDLHNSLLKGRLWPQIGKLRRSAKFPYLLVEGRTLDGPLAPNSIRGVLLAISDLGVIVLRSDDRGDTAEWLHRLAVRRQFSNVRIRPRYSQRPQAPVDAVPEAMLAAVPGISRLTARAILERFGCIRAVAAASEDALLAVEGVGLKRARALIEAFRATPAASHSAKRNGHRAT